MRTAAHGNTSSRMITVVKQVCAQLVQPSGGKTHQQTDCLTQSIQFDQLFTLKRKWRLDKHGALATTVLVPEYILY